MSRFPHIRMPGKPNTAKWGRKCIRETTAFWTILRGVVRVYTCHAAECRKFEFCHLSIRDVHASWLAWVGRGFLIYQSACGLLPLARETIDSPRAIKCIGYITRLQGHAVAGTEVTFCLLKDGGGAMVVWMMREAWYSSKYKYYKKNAILMKISDAVSL